MDLQKYIYRAGGPHREAPKLHYIFNIMFIIYVFMVTTPTDVCYKYR